MNYEKSKIAMLILDGWGISAAWNGNAIKLADPKAYNYLWQTYPHWALKPYDNEIKNNDRLIRNGLGYSVISSGRFLPSNFLYIQNKIDNNELAYNRVINQVLANCRDHNSNLHLCGLISDNKITSYYKQIFPLVDLAKNLHIGNLYLHLILDNDGFNSRSQVSLIDEINSYLEDKNMGRIATVVGRKWAFDSESSNEKIIQTYHAIAQGKGNFALDAKQIIESNLLKGITSDQIPPQVIINDNKPVGKINDFDSLIFLNFDDRSLKYLTTIFVGQDTAIRRKEVYNVNVATFSDYFYLKEKSGYSVIFERDDLKPALPDLLSEENIRQLYLTTDIRNEHLSYFFQGGFPNISSNVEFSQISSEDDLMGLDKIFNRFLSAIKTKSHDFIVASVENCDYLAHKAKIKKISEAVKQVDSYLTSAEIAAIEANCKLIICSDHGFIEQLANVSSPNHLIDHTSNPVPFILVDKSQAKSAYQNISINDYNLSDILTSRRKLTDIAPTVLKMFEIEKPPEMTGESLI